MCESHSWAWTWRALDKYFCRSRELFVGKSVWRFLFEGDELGNSERVLTWNVPILLMTMGIIMISAFSVP